MPEEYRVLDATSSEARAFVADGLAARRPPDGNRLAGVEALRAEYREGFRPGCEATIAEFDARLTEVEVAGVPCLETTVGEPGDGAVLYLFGGGFVLGGPFEDVRFSAPLAAGLGLRVVAPYYPLAPEHPFPAAVDAATAVWRELLDTWPADRLVIAGESAGGNLALNALLDARGAGLPAPAACALFSPWSDLTTTGHSFEVDADPTLTTAEVGAFAAAYAGDAPLDDPRVSPLHADFGAWLPPTILTTGTRDLFLSLHARLATRFREAGVDLDLRVWEGMWHVFEFYREVPEARASMDEAVAFLAERVLRRGRS